jgi:hypothetical protein
VPLLADGYEPWGMFDSIKIYDWVLPLHHYSSAEELLASFAAKVIGPVQDMVTKRKALLS